MKSSPRSHWSTTQAAIGLGVSVSTVKRWVEEGLLPAIKTPGGHRKLLLTDLLELARRANLPVDRLTIAHGRRAARQPASAEQLQKGLYRALLLGSPAQVRGIVHGSYQAGLSIDQLADIVVAPAMRRIGYSWESLQIDVLHEHRATQLCLGILHELRALLEERAAKQRLVAVGGAIEGDPYALPTLLAQLVLLDAGWDAVDLGPNTPLASLLKAAMQLEARMIWVSASNLVDRENFVSEFAEFYRRADERKIAVVVGGRALTESVRVAIPYTAHGDMFRHLAAFAHTLQPHKNLPRRGRPPLRSKPPK